MTQVVRRLTDSGVNEFESWLQSVREGARTVPPLGLLTDEAHSEEMEFSAAVEDRAFVTRYDLGEYLGSVFRDVDPTTISRDTGLWSWLALFYFDQLCPHSADGQRAPRETYSYILSSNFRHFPRHAIRTTWDMVSRFGEDVRFLFSKSLDQRGEIIEQIAARQEFFTCETVIRAASLLYNDTERKTFKVGAAGRGAGSVARYIKVLQQFQLTYDLYALHGQEIVNLLPKEFEKYKKV